MTTLERQLEALGETLDTQYGPIEAADIRLSDQRDRPLWVGGRLVSVLRGSAVAVGAAVIVLLIVGLVPFLLMRDGSGESPVETTPAITATTEATSTTNLERSSDLELSEVAAPGGGGITGYAIAGSPSLAGLTNNGTSWIGDRLYALGSEALLSTPDGLQWQTELPLPPDLLSVVVASNASTPLVAWIPSPEGAVEDQCGWITPQEIVVAFKGESGEWTSSRIPLPFDDQPCISFWLGGVTAGPKGFLVTGFLQVEDADVTEQSFGWWSPDGQTWTSIEWTQALERIWSAIATDRGFTIGTPDWIGTSDDGITWEFDVGHEPLFLWRGQIVEWTTDGLRTYGDSSTLLVPAGDIPGDRIYLGEAGLLTGPSDGQPSPLLPTDGPVEFSHDGKDWSVITLSEFSALSDYMTVVGIGGDFIVLSEFDGNRIITGRQAAP